MLCIISYLGVDLWTHLLAIHLDQDLSYHNASFSGHPFYLKSSYM